MSVHSITVVGGVLGRDAIRTHWANRVACISEDTAGQQAALMTTGDGVQLLALLMREARSDENLRSMMEEQGVWPSDYETIADPEPLEFDEAERITAFAAPSPAWRAVLTAGMNAPPAV